MKNEIKLFFLIALFILIIASASAQETWTTYTINNGLGDNTVLSVALDSKGILWVGTYRGGLSRFDGTSWTTFNTDNVLPYNSVKYISIGPNDELWASVWYYDIVNFDGEQWTILNPPGDDVTSVAVGPDGRVWVGTDMDFHGHSEGISVYDGESWTTYTTDEGLAEDYIYSIAINSEGTVWVGTPRYISRFDGTSWTNFSSPVGTPLCLAVDDNGIVWIGTWENGISRYDSDTWETFTTNNGLAHNRVYAIDISPDGIVWVGTYGGVSYFDGNAWTTYTPNDGLVGNDVRCIEAEGENVIWIGTIQGLSRLELSPVTITNNLTTPLELTITGNYPNPFNPTTTIEYALPQDSQITLSIYNSAGQRVSVLKDEYQHAGNYSIAWNATGVPSGLYFCTLKANGFTETRKMMLVK